MDNYEIARDRAQAYFLNFDQKSIIRRWDLQYDSEYLYVTFVGRPYKVSRNSGRIDRMFDGRQAGFSEVMSIFDLLCHKSDDQFLIRRFAPVNSLRGCPVSVGVDVEYGGKIAILFDRNPAALSDVCLALGGKTVDLGDIGFALPLFGPMEVILKFYHGDDEFPPSITFLWDENTLNFVYYETVFYIAGFLMNTISEQIQKRIGGAL
jgi:hypothetical protein